MYLLDTDTCSYLMKRAHTVLIDRVRTFRPGELKVSVVTQYELEYGVHRSGRTEELGLVVAAFLGNVEVLPFDVPAARRAAQIRGDLAASGRPTTLRSSSGCRVFGSRTGLASSLPG